MTIGKYEVRGGVAISPTGSMQEIKEMRELTAKERKDADKIIKQVGIEDPVVSDWMILPRRVAEAAIRQREGERASIAKNVPGLEELRKARVYDANQRDAFSRSVYRGSGRLTGNPESNTAASVAKQYPRAAAYLKAESYAHSTNVAKSAAGRAAMNAIASGKSHTAAIKKMENEWSKYTESKKWI